MRDGKQQTGSSIRSRPVNGVPRRLCAAAVTIVLVLALLLPVAPEANETVTPALWEVWMPGAAAPYMYLFGSIHFGSAALYPLNRPVERAFASAGTLVVELAPTPSGATAAARAVQRFAVLPPDATLQTQIPASLWKRVQAQATQLPWLENALTRYRPWFVATLLTKVAMEQLGLTERYGVDRYFLTRANGKAVIALETLEQQAAILADLSPIDASRFLDDAVSALENDGGYLSALVTAWRTGNAATLHQLIHTALDTNGLSATIRNKLFADRNRGMVERLGQLKATPGGHPYFVVVGAGHMLGPTGLVNGMRAAGRAVHRVSHH